MHAKMLYSLEHANIDYCCVFIVDNTGILKIYIFCKNNHKEMELYFVTL